MSEREEGYSSGDERRKRLKIGKDLGLKVRVLCEL